MRGLRIAYILIAISLLGLAGASFLLSSGSSCVAPAGAGALSAQLAVLAPGAAFDISAPADAWAGWLESQISDPGQSPLAGIVLDARPGRLLADVCLRQSGRLPTRLHAAFTFAPAADGLRFDCVELALGRLWLPAPIRALVALQLNVAWRQMAGGWHVDLIELDSGRIRIAGRRR